MSSFPINYANVLRLYNAGKVSMLPFFAELVYLLDFQFNDAVRWGMLFDVGADYAAMLVPVPFRAGVEEPSSVDDLFTSYWVQSQSDEDWWENLGKYKLDIEIGAGTSWLMVIFR